MRRVLSLLLLILFTGTAFGYVSSPEALIPASGQNEAAELTNFAVIGENLAGVISSASYVSGVGLASMIFTPLLPQAGQPVPTVPTPEGDVLSYPNPFNPNNNQLITIAYKLSQDAEVKVFVFDITGQLVQTINTSSSNRWSDGYSRVSWDGRSGFGEAVDNGVYFIQIVSQGRTIGKTKVIVVK